MPLFFNLKELEKNDIGGFKFLEIFKDYYYKSTKKDSYIRKYKYNLNGTSYLLNTAPLFSIPTDVSYIIQYIKLASLRDYTAYKLFRVSYLDLSYFPDVDIEAIKHNPLIKISKNKIYFKFEEAYNGTKVW